MLFSFEDVMDFGLSNKPSRYSAPNTIDRHNVSNKLSKYIMPSTIHRHNVPKYLFDKYFPELIFFVINWSDYCKYMDDVIVCEKYPCDRIIDEQKFKLMVCVLIQIDLFLYKYYSIFSTKCYKCKKIIKAHVFGTCVPCFFTTDTKCKIDVCNDYKNILKFIVANKNICKLLSSAMKRVFYYDRRKTIISNDIMFDEYIKTKNRYQNTIIKKIMLIFNNLEDFYFSKELAHINTFIRISWNFIFLVEMINCEFYQKYKMCDFRAEKNLNWVTIMIFGELLEIHLFTLRLMTFRIAVIKQLLMINLKQNIVNI